MSLSGPWSEHFYLCKISGNATGSNIAIMAVMPDDASLMQNRSLFDIFQDMRSQMFATQGPKLRRQYAAAYAAQCLLGDNNLCMNDLMK